MPTGFPENGGESLSPEFSDELTVALAAGRWWAIMEVSRPISEEPEYRYLTSGLWWETVEAEELHDRHPWSSEMHLRRCSTEDHKVVEAEEETGSTHVSWVYTGSICARQGAPLHTSSKKGNLTSSFILSNASEKALYSDSTLKTMEKWRQKKTGRTIVNRPLGSLLEELDVLLSSFSEDGTPLIVLGDFNIHLEKPQAADFHTLLASFDLKRVSTAATHKSGIKLDLIYTCFSSTDHTLVTPLHTSDHFLTLNLNLPQNTTHTPPQVTFRRNLLSPSRLSSLVSSTLPPPDQLSTLDTNSATDTLFSTLTPCLDNFCPLSSRPAHATPSAPWLKVLALMTLLMISVESDLSHEEWKSLSNPQTRTLSYLEGRESEAQAMGRKTDVKVNKNSNTENTGYDKYSLFLHNDIYDV
ncbi:unnamed protein product [Leuciscus chuanchicus]